MTRTEARAAARRASIAATLLLALCTLRPAAAYSGYDVTVYHSGQDWPNYLLAFNVVQRSQFSICAAVPASVFPNYGRVFVATDFSRLQQYGMGAWNGGGTTGFPSAPYATKIGDTSYKYIYNITLYADSNCNVMMRSKYASRPPTAGKYATCDQDVKSADPEFKAPQAYCESMNCPPGDNGHRDASYRAADSAGDGSLGGAEWNYMSADYKALTIGPYYTCTDAAGAQVDFVPQSIRVRVYLYKIPQHIEFNLFEPTSPPMIALALEGCVKLAGALVLLMAMIMLPVFAFAYKYRGRPKM
eukprot:tig00020556_g11009.t1